MEQINWRKSLSNSLSSPSLPSPATLVTEVRLPWPFSCLIFILFSRICYHRVLLFQRHSVTTWEISTCQNKDQKPRTHAETTQSLIRLEFDRIPLKTCWYVHHIKLRFLFIDSANLSTIVYRAQFAICGLLYRFMADSRNILGLKTTPDRSVYIWNAVSGAIRPETVWFSRGTTGF